MINDRTNTNYQGSYQNSGFNFPDLNEFDPAEDRDNGWLISFTDILMLLITMFVLMMAINQVVPHEALRQDKGVAQERSSPTGHNTETQPERTQDSAQPSVKKPPVFSIPQDIKDKVDVVATTTAMNVVIKDDVLFAEGSTQLKPVGHTILDGIVEMLRQSDYPVSVEGHTDNVPIDTAQFPSNWELSSFRATNVARYFIQHGIAADRLSAVGYADTRPIADNNNAAGRALNRRVSLIIKFNEQVDTSRVNIEKNASELH